MLALTLALALQVTPLERAHSHNDYWRPRPLLDALEQGFCSVEADVFLVGSDLLVGHSKDELKPGRTLEALYLDPLRERVRANGGRVYPNGPEFTLLVDVKENGEAVYKRLRVLLDERREMLATDKPGAVRVIVSGDRARRAILRDPDALMGLDGRRADLYSELPSYRIPLVSEDWKGLFDWRGIGPVPQDTRLRIRDFVTLAHARGRKVRFWAAPQNRNAFTVLYDQGVDLINTDRLADLAEFLREKAGRR